MPDISILCIEDDETLRTIIVQNLQARGYLVHVATDGQQALTLMHEKHFDLMLLDINLPDRSGWEVLRTAVRQKDVVPIETQEHEQIIPIVVLSAVRVSPQRLAEFHPLAYLPKPFPMETLLRLVSEVAELKRRSIIHTSYDRVEQTQPLPPSWEDSHA